MSNFVFSLERALAQMAAQFESQSNRVVSILTNPKNLNAQKLQGAKPRIFVYAQVNWNNELTLLWGRQSDEGSSKVIDKGIFYGTDYVDIQPTWSNRGAPANALLCFKPEDYSPDCVECPTPQDRIVLQNALEQGLLMFLVKLTEACQVQVLSWPAYSSKGKLEIANLQHLNSAFQSTLSKQAQAALYP